MLVGVALSTAVRGVYGPGEDRSDYIGPDTHRCRVPTRHLWGEGKAARLRAAPTALLFESPVLRVGAGLAFKIAPTVRLLLL
jgi:hypothetical protein